MFFNMSNHVCKDCWRFQSFKEDCNFHWPKKQECSKFMEHEFDNEKFKTMRDKELVF